MAQNPTTGQPTPFNFLKRGCSRHPTHRQASRQLFILLLAGYVLLIGLMGALIIHSLANTRVMEDQLRRIVEDRNLKIQLATDLQEASYARHSSLVYQTLTEDPFVRDEHFQNYIRSGYEVGKARTALRQLPLDQTEQDNLTQQDTLVGEIVLLHETISDAAANGNLPQAQHMIANDLRPLNHQFINAVETLRRYERDRIRDSLRAGQEAIAEGKRFNLTLGAVMTLLSLVIAGFSLRRLSCFAQTIDYQMVMLEASSEQLEHEATHDPLTGLANRTLFYQRLADTMTQAQQAGQSVLVAYLDMDGLKPVNDQYGHAAGDALIQRVSERLRQVVRATDTVARLGGDEFALVLLMPQNEAQCDKVVAMIDSRVSVPADLGGGLMITPRFSIGCAVFPRDGTEMDELLHLADAEMYRIKRSRKNHRGAE